MYVRTRSLPPEAADGMQAWTCTGKERGIWGQTAMRQGDRGRGNHAWSRGGRSMLHRQPGGDNEELTNDATRTKQIVDRKGDEAVLERGSRSKLTRSIRSNAIIADQESRHARET